MGIIIPLPIALVLAGAIFWPVTLAIAAVLGVVGVLASRPWVRITCFIIAAVLAADCVVALWLPGE